MGFFLVMIGLMILVAVINILKKESPNSDRSKSRSNHASTHIDYSSTATFVSVEDSNTHNCSDNVSSYSDTSSCSDSGASSD
ncbi:hypothetical protein AMS59_01435 [Lysinibacillus sp. FJAT-14745]|uniref:hypothetical protein n=1 Tax=Lysinibacillus sp. FJAT-14745 TaxID=1704289 RepID=UPI0006ABD31A|nr:hypothetical protein [Lysinibacillus sp. FJAT-14745]KOP80102.1 hypothetical protein AMS59_01435 [Lysinibacillus sp. FJAT-14745]